MTDNNKDNNQSEQDNQIVESQPDTQDNKVKRTGGLYRGLTISAKAANIASVVTIALLMVIIIYAVMNGGFTVTFDSNGGTDVESFQVDYGVYEGELDTPTREEYTFDGWYLDENFTTEYTSDYIFSDNTTLYAKWTAND